MTYMRVIPRDLFNEANLLKCLGRIYINLENLCDCKVTLESDGRAFQIDQSQSSGAINCANVKLSNGIDFFRPLNSRDPWPLYANLPDDECAVFNDDGTFTAEFLRLLKWPT